jgi:hypothetical protein
MLSSELESCLNQAFHQAGSAHHEFLTIEHLLLAILSTATAREMLRGFGADLDPVPTSRSTLRPTICCGYRYPAKNAWCIRSLASSACCSAPYTR